MRAVRVSVGHDALARARAVPHLRCSDDRPTARPHAANSPSMRSGATTTRCCCCTTSGSADRTVTDAEHATGAAHLNVNPRPLPHQQRRLPLHALDIRRRPDPVVAPLTAGGTPGRCRDRGVDERHARHGHRRCASRTMPETRIDGLRRPCWIQYERRTLRIRAGDYERVARATRGHDGRLVPAPAAAAASHERSRPAVR